jgi:hypothetical protein
MGLSFVTVTVRGRDIRERVRKIRRDCGKRLSMKAVA